MSPSRSITRRYLAGLALAATAAGAGLGASPSATAGASAPSGVKTRAQVPWASVDSTWIAASVDKGGHNNLILVSPAGQSYLITSTLPKNDFVHAVSSNGRYALVGMSVYDLKTGKALPGSTGGGEVFTKPTGTAVLSGQDRVTKRSLDGRVLKQGPAVGPGDSVWGILPSPDGLTDVVTTSRTVRLVDNASLRPIRTFTTPNGTNSCRPGHFVDATTFTVACASRNSTGPSTVYLMNTRTGAATKVTNGTYPGGNGYEGALGFEDAWRTPLGTLASPQFSMQTFKRTLYTVNAGKITKTHTLSLPSDMAQWPLKTDSVLGTSAYVRGSKHEGPDPTVAIRWNVKTGAVNYLAGAHSQFGGTANGWALVGQESHE